MSFAGHVFDMIRRNKENREMLDRLREQSRGAKTRYGSRLPDTTVEEMDTIKRQTEERQRQEQGYVFRRLAGWLGLALAVAGLLGVLFHFFG